MVDMTSMHACIRGRDMDYASTRQDIGAAKICAESIQSMAFVWCSQRLAKRGLWPVWEEYYCSRHVYQPCSAWTCVFGGISPRHGITNSGPLPRGSSLNNEANASHIIPSTS